MSSLLLFKRAWSEVGYPHRREAGTLLDRGSNLGAELSLERTGPTVNNDTASSCLLDFVSPLP